MPTLLNQTLFYDIDNLQLYSKGTFIIFICSFFFYHSDDFKPASIDTTQPAELTFGTNKECVVTYPNQVSQYFYLVISFGQLLLIRRNFILLIIYKN